METGHVARLYSKQVFRSFPGEFNATAALEDRGKQEWGCSSAQSKGFWLSGINTSP
jgi:hypothetical protein